MSACLMLLAALATFAPASIGLLLVGLAARDAARDLRAYLEARR